MDKITHIAKCKLCSRQIGKLTLNADVPDQVVARLTKPGACKNCAVDVKNVTFRGAVVQAAVGDTLASLAEKKLTAVEQGRVELKKRGWTQKAERVKTRKAPLPTKKPLAPVAPTPAAVEPTPVLPDPAPTPAPAPPVVAPAPAPVVPDPTPAPAADATKNPNKKPK